MLPNTKKGYGYVTYALNTDTTDYEKMAVLFGLSVITTHKKKMPMAVIVNDASTCRKDLYEIFDHVVQIPNDHVVNPMQWECKILELSPFKETVKFECDMLCTSDISVWQHHFRNYDLCFTSKVLGFDQQVKDDSVYRKFIKNNLLPNVYNGLYYIRLTKNNNRLMQTAWKIFNNWQTELKMCRKFHKESASTDFVFALALAKHNMHQCTDTTLLPTFIHNKPSICKPMQYFSIPDPCTVIVDSQKLTMPFHYHQKEFCTEELISKYKQHV